MDSRLSLHRSTRTQEFDVDTAKLGKLVVRLLKILFLRRFCALGMEQLSWWPTGLSL
jgi:hypothetical protein